MHLRRTSEAHTYIVEVNGESIGRVWRTGSLPSMRSWRGQTASGTLTTVPRDTRKAAAADVAAIHAAGEATRSS